MTQSHEVLAMMDAHTTTFGRTKGCTISRCGAFFVCTIFLISLVVTGLLVYHYAPCLEDKQTKSCSTVVEDCFDGPTARAFPGGTANKRKIDVRLPKSVIPESYELRLVPFIWEGNFTFNGEVTILVNVTEDTKNVTLHATDMKIDESITSIREFSQSGNETKPITIAEQKNDTERQFHVIKTSDTLKEGKQYVVHLKFVGHLNDYLQGFYRSSYTVGNQTRSPLKCDQFG